MQTLKWTAIVLAVAIVAVAGIQAQNGKEVTLKGSITCAKCDLGKEKTCMTVIEVKEGADKGVYYFDAAANKKYHGNICKAAKAGTVKGEVGKDKDKKTIKVSDVKYD